MDKSCPPPEMQAVVEVGVAVRRSELEGMTSRVFGTVPVVDARVEQGAESAISAAGGVADATVASPPDAEGAMTAAMRD